MAGGQSDYTRGTMQVDAQSGTFSGFMDGTKYGGALVALCVIMPTLVFAVGLHWFPSLVATLILGFLIGMGLKLKGGWTEKIVAGMRKGSGITGVLSPTDNPKYAEACAKAGVTAYALDYIPRISRAQSMDVLSSQSMMMTAAGTIAPAKVFIMGVGVAGLQAIATARRLGAVTTATDVRPATKEQVAI